MPGLVDHGIAALLLVVWPAWVAIRGQEQMRAAAADPAGRMAIYRTTMAVQWAHAAAFALAAAAVAALRLQLLRPRPLRLVLPLRRLRRLLRRRQETASSQSLPRRKALLRLQAAARSRCSSSRCQA